MKIARRDLYDTGKRRAALLSSTSLYGNIAAGGRAVSQFSVAVVSPSKYQSIRTESHSVNAACRDPGDIGKSWSAMLSAMHRDRSVAACGRAVAQLSVTIISPVIDRSKRGERDRMIIAGCDLNDIDKKNPALLAAVYCDRRITAGGCAIAQLSVTIIPPGIDCAQRCKRDCMIIAGCDLHDIHKKSPTLLTSVHRDRCSPTSGCGVSKLSVTVIAPGENRAGCGKSYGMIIS